MRASNLSTLATLLVSLLTCAPSKSQPLTAGTGRPIEGSTGGTYRPNQSQSSDLNPSAKVHKDVYGKPCVIVAAHSFPKTDYRKIFGGAQASDGEQGGAKSKTFEHFVSGHNHCAITVRLKVCYYGSLNCVPMDVPGHDDQQVSLGISPEAGFHYQYTEQF
jgi:hypothetical protein